MPRKRIPAPVGLRKGRLTVTGDAPDGFKGRYQANWRMWRCRCDCGVRATIPMQYIQAGTVKSCGCLRSEQARERMQQLRAKLEQGKDESNGLPQSSARLPEAD